MKGVRLMHNSSRPVSSLLLSLETLESRDVPSGLTSSLAPIALTQATPLLSSVTNSVTAVADPVVTSAEGSIQIGTPSSTVSLSVGSLRAQVSLTSGQTAGLAVAIDTPPLSVDASTTVSSGGVAASVSTDIGPAQTNVTIDANVGPTPLDSGVLPLGVAASVSANLGPTQTGVTIQANVGQNTTEVATVNGQVDATIGTTPVQVTPGINLDAGPRTATPDVSGRTSEANPVTATPVSKPATIAAPESTLKVGQKESAIASQPVLATSSGDGNGEVVVTRAPSNQSSPETAAGSDTLLFADSTERIATSAETTTARTTSDNDTTVSPSAAPAQDRQLDGPLWGNEQETEGSLRVAILPQDAEVLQVTDDDASSLPETEQAPLNLPNPEEGGPLAGFFPLRFGGAAEQGSSLEFPEEAQGYGARFWTLTAVATLLAVEITRRQMRDTSTRKELSPGWATLEGA
jgi:hypothetical protein